MSELRRGDRCPKCAVGTLASMRYVAASGPWHHSQHRAGVEPMRAEHLLLLCDECAYGHEVPTADARAASTKELKDMLRGRR